MSILPSSHLRDEEIDFRAAGFVELTPAIFLPPYSVMEVPHRHHSPVACDANAKASDEIPERPQWNEVS